MCGDVRLGQERDSGNAPAFTEPSQMHANQRRARGFGRPDQNRWLGALQDSGDLRARVAGLFLEGKITGGAPLSPVVVQTRDEAVQLAAGFRDPAVYAIALSMCRASAVNDADGARRRLSIEHWTELEFDNAVPWLLLAGKARANGDDVAARAAFSHAAAAHKIDAYSDSLLSFAEPELPSDASPLERAVLAIEVIGVETATGLTHYGAAGQQCSREAMKDSTVRQQCKALAELFVAKGKNLLDLGEGKAIGERAGWTRERLEKLGQEQHALMQAIMLQAPLDDVDNAERWGWEALNRTNDYIAQRAHLGELGAAREALDRSRESPEEMAREYTLKIDRLIQRSLMPEQMEAPDRNQ